MVHAQDSAVQVALKQSISFYQSNYYRKESQVNALKSRNRSVLLFLSIILLLVFWYLLARRIRSQRDLIIDEMSRTGEIQQELDMMKVRNEEMDNVIATLFENRIKILQTLSDQYELLEESQNSRIRENRNGMSKDEIISSFRNNMRDLRKDHDIALSMEGILDSWKDGIMKKLQIVFGEDSHSGVKMTQDELNIAPYFFSGMNYKTISYLTGYSEPSLRVRKTRFKQKIQMLDDSFSEEKRLFLANL